MPAALTKVLTHWAAFQLGRVFEGPPSRIKDKPATTVRIEVVARLIVTPAHCRMLLQRHVWKDVAATAKPCCLPTPTARWNMETTRQSVAATSTIHMKKKNGMAPKHPNTLHTRNQPQKLSPKFTTTWVTLSSTKNTPTMRPDPTTVCSRVGSVLGMINWMINCNPISSPSRRNILKPEKKSANSNPHGPLALVNPKNTRICRSFRAASKLNDIKPSSQLRHKKCATEGWCWGALQPRAWPNAPIAT